MLAYLFCAPAGHGIFVLRAIACLHIFLRAAWCPHICFFVLPGAWIFVLRSPGASIFVLRAAGCLHIGSACRLMLPHLLVLGGCWGGVCGEGASGGVWPGGLGVGVKGLVGGA